MEIESMRFMLMAQDVSRAVKFYRDTLGLSVKSESPHWAELSFQGEILAFHPGWTGEKRKTDLGFRVKDIEAACQKAVEGGAELIMKPQEELGGIFKLAKLADTEGNEFAFTQRLRAPVQAQTSS